MRSMLWKTGWAAAVLMCSKATRGTQWSSPSSRALEPLRGEQGIVMPDGKQKRSRSKSCRARARHSEMLMMDDKLIRGQHTHVTLLPIYWDDHSESQEGNNINFIPFEFRMLLL